jgi:hypothetical protein
MASGQGQFDYVSLQYITNLTKRVVDLERALIEVLKRFPTDLNRGDSQRNVDERVFAH